MNTTLWLVVPCYNEEEVLPATAKKLREVLHTLIAAGKAGEGSRIVFVNDGSQDRTWQLIRALHEEDPCFLGISLAHNRGHQNALLAGLMEARAHADVTISLDADLQDDTDAIETMMDEYHAGAEIVYGVRSARNTDTFFKRFTAENYYRLLSSLGVEIVYNHADFRLMSRRSLDALAAYGESNLFLRGIVPQIGMQTATVTYERRERTAGRSKYSLGKMLALAWDGISSFSTRPLLLPYFGAAVCGVAALALFVAALIRRFAFGIGGSGCFVSAAVFFVGVLLLLALGVLSQYVGKIYTEVKHRPRYLIDEVLYDTVPLQKK